jgi:very-short-patch-repair endonuclease
MDEIRRRARQLRKDPTDAEWLLWRKLRFWQIDGFKFRRQPLDGILSILCVWKRDW